MSSGVRQTEQYSLGAIQNKAKKFIDPSLEGAAAAADIANLPDNMEV